MSDFSSIANSAKQFACTLYKAQPGALVPTPFVELLHLVWDNFCDPASFPPSNPPPGLPPPPASQFSGGQCIGVSYIITAIIKYVSSGSEATLSQGGFYIVNGYRVGRDEYNRIALFVNCNNYPTQDQPGGDISVGAGFLDFTVISFTVARADGGSDNCGNPPAKFPPSPPPPPDGYTSPPTAITFNDNSTHNYTFNFKPPSAPPSPANFLPPVVINFSKPEANFKIPIAFNFDGSINFGGGGDINFNEGDRSNINNINNATNNINNSVGNINNTTNKTANEINNFINITNNEPPNPTDYNPPDPPVAPGSYTKNYLEAVEVTLTAIPVNLRQQEGYAAPNVLYAGWFEFTRNGKALPREPIHFENGVFLAPTGVDGYAFTLYTGVQGSAVAITKKEKV